MDRKAGPGARLGFAAQVLLVALRFCTARGGSPCAVSQRRTLCNAHSLCYNFTVYPHPSPGEPWCVVQGQVDGNVFLSYHCGGTKIQSTSPLGEEVKTMNTWETQTETLRDIGNFLKGQLPDIIPEKHTARGPLTLQARMTCHCEEDGHISGSWQFGFNGEMCLRFDSENGHWTEVHSGGRRMKEKWESCDRLLQESLHGRLSGLASGFYSVLGENVEDLSITDHRPPYSAVHGHSHQVQILDPPHGPHQFHHLFLG